MKEKTIDLLEPLIVGGTEMHQVTIRRSTVGDEEDAMEMAIRLKRPKNSVTVEVCMFSKLTKLPYDAVRSMCGQDYTALREALSALNTPLDAVDPTETSLETETDGIQESSL